MTYTADITDSPDSEAHRDPPGGNGSAPGDGAPPPARVPKLGVWSWSFVGVVVALIFISIAFAAVSEIALPLIFAAVLAICFKPLVGLLQRKGLKPPLAAGLVVLGLILLMAGVFVATVKGVVDQADKIGELADAALEEAGDHLDEVGVSEEALDDAKEATESAAPMATDGVLTKLVEGVGSLIGLASGIILGALIMYYLLKDGSLFRRKVVERSSPALRDDVDGFIGDACRILRDYGKGRSIMSGIVSVVIGLTALLLGLPLVFTIMVVNFVGGYIPYIGAFLGGGLAVIVAMGDGGIVDGLIMLAVVLASNLMLENFVEPKVMGQSLDIHPMVVLVVTALGGLLGGIVGLILAVPAYVIARSAFSRFRSRGVVEMVADKAQPAVAKLLE